ncbi:MAG: putative Cl-channel, voltage gated [Ilumatobacteraceae bacterium]|nr:putative Cl-channel, voltage gated [Ilumatobacteraceae bacterium]
MNRSDHDVPATWRWWLLVATVGIVSGAVSAGYVEALRNITRVLGPEHTGRWAHLAVLAGVGLVIALVVRVLGNPGDVELLVDNIHVGGRPADIRPLRALIPVSILGIAAGSAIGPEAPLVQTTGTIGSWVAARRNVSPTDARILTITGMAAGFTVLFGAPLGGALFALEILHRRGLEYYEAMLPAAIGALTGWVTFAAALHAGFHPVFEFPAAARITSLDLLLGLAAGVAGALVATVFAWMIRLMRMMFARIPLVVRPVVGGVALGALAFASPFSLTFGEGQIEHIASVRIAVSVLLLAGLCKLVATATIVSSGWRGGFIIPLFFMGATIAMAATHAMHGHDVVILTATMVAANVGVTKTPFGSTAVVAEMAGMRILPPVLIAALVSLLLTDRVSIIHTQRARSVVASTAPSS